LYTTCSHHVLEKDLPVSTCIDKKNSLEYVDFGPKNIKFKEIP
jgi:hypothetical protein